MRLRIKWGAAGVVVVAMAALAGAGHPKHDPPCAVCVPGTETKKTTSYAYSTRDEVKCFPKVHRRRWACLWRRDPACEACERPVAARVLIKKKMVEESVVARCEAAGQGK